MTARALLCVTLAGALWTACGDEPTPELMTLTPGDVERGDTVTVTGVRFGSSGAVVLTAFSDDTSFDVSSQVAEWADSQVTFVIPDDFMEQRYLLHVEVDGQRSNCLDVEVVLPPDPLIDVVSPPAGLPGDTISVDGSEFGDGEGRLLFSPDIPAVITDWSATQIVATVPPGVESDRVRVETGRGLLSPWAPFVVADADAPTLTLIQTTIFTPRCATASCHGTARQGDLSLVAGESYSELVNIAATNLPSLMRVEPLAPDSSFLIDKLSSVTPASGSRMPFGETPLPVEQIELIREWIAQGALDN